MNITDEQIDALAKEYAKEKSSSEVFRTAHENDFKAGFSKALSLFAVSKCEGNERRNLLIDFGNQVVEIQNRYHCILQDVEKEVDAYLKSINNC